MNSYIEIKAEGKRVPVINYLKGFSIFTIVLMHLISMMSQMPSKIVTLSAIGGSGVHVFFFCSGVGLYMSYLSYKTKFVEFIRKRFFKIYIPYIFVVFISFLLPWMYENGDRVTALLSHVFLFKMFIPEYEESFGVQFWFVSTIIQLYLLFIPMCILKEKIKSNKKFVGYFLVISIVWWIICYKLGLGSVRIWNSFCLQYIWEFALGFVIAQELFDKKEFKIKIIVLLIAAVIGIGLQAALAMQSEVFKLFNDIPALIGYMSLSLLLMKIPPVLYVANKLSVFSYELFLIHMLIFRTGFYFVQPKSLFSQCFAGCLFLSISIVISYFYHKIILLISRKH